MSGKTVLVIGEGGREHAIIWKLSQSSEVGKIYVSRGNAGIKLVDKVEVISLDSDVKLAAKWCKENKVDLVVVGPEAPLANGIADALNEVSVKCFGPTKLAAKIESDKVWSKQLMDNNNIPTAKWESFTVREKALKYIKSENITGCVVKASGLAAGKGVFVTSNTEETISAVNSLLLDKKFGSAGNEIIIEEKLDGPEVSVLAFCDGRTVKPMLPAQDHKRALDDDKGNNTGGMGAYCPCPLLTNEEVEQVSDMILKPTVNALSALGTPFIGVLYAGLMLTSSGPKVLEFNCRFGDPETEVILPLLKTDLYKVMEACSSGILEKITLEWLENQSAVGVVMASKGYPESSSKGDVITGVDQFRKRDDIVIFHMGTATDSTNQLLTNGGRVLSVVALAPKLVNAAAKATTACRAITFDGAHFRSDIAHKGIAISLLQSGTLTYEASGVSITAGDQLVSHIKNMVKATYGPGCSSAIGGFGAVFDLKNVVTANGLPYKEPLLVSGTDGVGTKLKIADATGNHTNVGIDLVAMCANDVICHGAQPLFFLDYFATSKLDPDSAKVILEGITKGCLLAGCALVGGETAEMPGMYQGEDYDLAGFVVGAVEKSSVLPRPDLITNGDAVIGILSSGVHSNGFSLVRRIVEDSGLSYSDPCPFGGATLGEELLTPTEIYVKTVLPVLQKGIVNAAAHITGGGLLENVPRVLPQNVKVQLDASKWKIPNVYPWLAASGGVSEPEMLRTFNCGIGFLMIVSQDNKNAVLKEVSGSIEIGNVLQRQEGEGQVEVLNFSATLTPLMQPHLKSVVGRLTQRKRVAVLISGSGTNLQALIDKTTNSHHAEIVLVISNKEGVYGLKRAENVGIKAVVVKHDKYSSRQAFEEAIQELLVNEGIEIVCLAGFMRILTGWFVQKWKGKLLNIHPSLLPSFKGAHGVKDALEAGVRVTGCTAHFVEESIDSGAIIAQEAIPVDAGDTEESLLEKMHKAEHRIFPKALLLLASGRAKLDPSTNKMLWSS